MDKDNRTFIVLLFFVVTLPVSAILYAVDLNRGWSDEQMRKLSQLMAERRLIERLRDKQKSNP
jgi:hypothetical protein